MENEKGNQSIVNLSFVVMAFLAYFVVMVLFQTLADAFGSVQRLHSINLLQHGLPVAAGLITFCVMFFNKKIHTFTDDVISEVRKIVWPSQRDTLTMTAVVCVMCIVAGMGFGVFDFCASQLIKIFVGV